MQPLLEDTPSAGRGGKELDEDDELDKGDDDYDRKHERCSPPPEDTPSAGRGRKEPGGDGEEPESSGLKNDAYESETLEMKCDVCHYEKNFAARGAVTTNASLRRDLAELLRKQGASDADIDEYWKELREKDKGRA